MCVCVNQFKSEAQICASDSRFELLVNVVFQEEKTKLRGITTLEERNKKSGQEYITKVSKINDWSLKLEKVFSHVKLNVKFS